MKEIWKDIKGYEGLYQVSNLGKVKSIKWFNPRTNKHYKRNKILKQIVTNKGYLEIKLTKNYKCKIFKVHRLVAEAFIPNPNKLPQVNHKSKIKSDNSVSNLEWCTGLYNIRYSKAKKIIQYDLNDNFIKEWESISDAAKELNIPTTHISKCCLGKLNKTHSYKWRYKQDVSNSKEGSDENDNKTRFKISK